jgi:hypothetical protein
MVRQFDKNKLCLRQKLFNVFNVDGIVVLEGKEKIIDFFGLPSGKYTLSDRQPASTVGDSIDAVPFFFTILYYLTSFKPGASA